MRNEINPIISNIKILQMSFWHCFLFSCLINIFSLALPVYSMQVLDRVLGSSSIETLIWLSIIIFIMVFANILLGNIRDSAFAFIANLFEKKLLSTIFIQNVKDQLKTNIGTQYLKDLGTIKSFITSPQLSLIFDIPWVIVFLAVIFYIHWILGFVILGSTIFLAFMAFLNHKILKSQTEKLNEIQMALVRKLELLMRNCEVILGNGMVSNVNARYNKDLERFKTLEQSLKSKTKVITTAVKTMRYGVQISITFISAILIIKGKMSSGGMIAISTLSGKVLAPFDAASSVFISIVSLKKAYERLKNAIKNIIEDRTILPIPKGNIATESLIYVPNGSAMPVIKGISFKVEAGQVIGIIGKSGSGKTTLARLLTGIFEATRGKVMLDNSPLNLWNLEQLGNYIGYLPQDVELFYATIKENICRFDEKATDDKIISASQKAGIHELVMSFQNGYETSVEQVNISAGQRQRIALARAFYNDPRVLVLDEPNSNLDIEGENALLNAILRAKKENTTVFIISHKPSILKVTDKIMIIADGELKGFDDAQKVIESFSKVWKC